MQTVTYTNRLTSSLREETGVVVVVHIVLLDCHHSLNAWVLHGRQNVAVVDRVGV